MCLQQAEQWRKVCFMLREFAVYCIVRICVAEYVVLHRINVRINNILL